MLASTLRRTLLTVAISATFFAAPSAYCAEAHGEGSSAASVALSPTTTLSPTTATFSEFRLVGTIQPDGRFRKAPRRYSRSPFDGSVLQRMKDEALPVPASLGRHSVGEQIENFAPPAVATAGVPRMSRFSGLTSEIATLVYGRAPVLVRPEDVVTDSRARLIVSDPGSGCIHVLDGVDSFRIAAGPSRRLRRPAGVTVGREDRIMIADSELGVVQVYGPQGQFIETLGLFDEEPIFERPTSIAYSHARQWLYVVDTPVNEVVALDESGRVRHRVGGRRDPERFHRPTEVAVNGDTVVVLDDSASRIQVFDRDFKLLSSFRIRNAKPEGDAKLGLAVDAEGLIYVSSFGASTLHVYTREGKLVHGIGRLTANHGTAPSALWVETSGKVYLGDGGTQRIAVLEPVRSDLSSR